VIPDPYPVEPLVAPFDATVSVPGSKSITNRALVCAALAAHHGGGASTISGALFADDTEAMVVALGALGLSIAGDTDLRIDGAITQDDAVLDARQAGTVARFLLPVLALMPGRWRLDASAQLRARPLLPLLAALEPLGARCVATGEGGTLPVDVVGGTLTERHTTVSGDVSSQFLSALMLIGPCLPQGLVVELTSALVSRPYVEMTASVMRSFGADVHVEARSVEMQPGGYRGTSYVVEPDASAASYPLAAAALTGSRTQIDGLGASSLQGDLAFVDHLAAMGAEVDVSASRVTVRGTGGLVGIDADLADCSDIAPTLAVCAALADSPTSIGGIGFIRRKETDRIAAVVTELRRCGIDASELPDGIAITPAGAPRTATVRTYDDHRMAMSFATLALARPGISISDPGCVAKTFPGFWDMLAMLRTPLR
jgi:3-phosphoshikimate 1-carboxyvinyltransferase